MQFDYYEYDIAGIYACALINGDTSGFNDDDHEWFDDFIADLPKVKNGHWDIIDDEPSFRCDDVSGLWADCYECRLYFPID